MRLLFVLGLALFAGCAQAGQSGDVDSGVRNDSSRLDSSTGGTDSSTSCTMVVTDLLANGDFDGTPAGTGWTAAPIDAAYPIVTGDTGGITAQSATIRAWMGGLERASASNKDSLYQDVMVPATTTMLALTGFYEVRTAEYINGTYDFGKVELLTTAGTQIELIKDLDDDHATTAWTPLDYTITALAMAKGQTVRLRFSTASDSTDVTSFFFDTLKLNATHCQ